MIKRYKINALLIVIAFTLTAVIALSGCMAAPTVRNITETQTPGNTPSADTDVFVSEISETPTEAAEEVIPTPTIDPNDWRAKFADKFTDGDVEHTENSYKSANINITIEKVQKEDLTYFLADIYVAELKYFKTAFPIDPDVMDEREYTDVVARENNAILAINGDHCIDNPGTIVRNGEMYREPKSSSDALVMNYDGSLHTYSSDEFDVEANAEGAYQVWTFGPMLLHDGQPMTEFNLPDSIADAHPRTAIGYYEPGHYCFVVVDGRQPGYSEGLDLQRMSQFFYDLGCSVAFNLDGGRSSAIVFMGETINQPCEGGRTTTDILYVGE